MQCCKRLAPMTCRRRAAIRAATGTAHEPVAAEWFWYGAELEEWSEHGRAARRSKPRPGTGRRGRLAGSSDGAEARPSQADHACAAVSSAFMPREEERRPNVVLAEAGTGVGKTLVILLRQQMSGPRKMRGSSGSRPMPPIYATRSMANWTGSIRTRCARR